MNQRVYEAHMQINRLLVLAGGLALVIGSRLPWMSVPILYGVQGAGYEAIEIGWEDNGYVTGGVGLMLLFAAFFWRKSRSHTFSILTGALSALATVVAVGCVYSIFKINPTEGFAAAADIGMYVTLGGAFTALIGALCPGSPPHLA